MHRLNPDLKVLVIDDSTSMRRIEKTLLAELGIFNVDEASDGQKGLDKLLEDEYDLVMLDWSMPNMSGIDLLREMRKSEKLVDVPVIMVTAEGLRQNIIAAGKAGANSYLTKPFSAEKLATQLARMRLKPPA